LKVTQDNLPSVWKCIPKQDFTSASDIDWSQSIPDIDRQLYAKYGLDENEIAFIESHVKEMV
jgi:type II restriction enzyme